MIGTVVRRSRITINYLKEMNDIKILLFDFLCTLLNISEDDIDVTHFSSEKKHCRLRFFRHGCRDCSIKDNGLFEEERRLNAYLNSNKLEQLENQHVKIDKRWGTSLENDSIDGYIPKPASQGVPAGPPHFRRQMFLPFQEKEPFLSFSPARIRSKNREEGKLPRAPEGRPSGRESEILLKDACVRAWAAYRLLWCQSLPW
ncbi:hypothetical protein TNCV_488551 [Trichonephila clavipes]|nr:hypothetical protein TNCV_488551 [Trichonephila clavipes]